MSCSAVSDGSQVHAVDPQDKSLTSTELEFDDNKGVNAEMIKKFVSNPVHTAVNECCKLRPSVDISTTGSSTAQDDLKFTFRQ